MLDEIINYVQSLQQQVEVRNHDQVFRFTVIQLRNYTKTSNLEV